MRILLVDNRDSYTFNLLQLVGEACGEAPEVVDHRAHPAAELLARRPDAIVLSPGPGRPDRTRDAGVCGELVRTATVPLLGVCLGHQVLAHAHGGEVARAVRVAHGRTSPVLHDGTGPLAGLPQRFRATRYHSLVVRRVPPALRVTARTPRGAIMGLAHRHLPQWGVQFHPESVCTEHGLALMTTFLALVRAHADGQDATARGRPRIRPVPSTRPRRAAVAGAGTVAGAGAGGRGPAAAPPPPRPTNATPPRPPHAATTPAAPGAPHGRADAPTRLLVRDLDRWLEPEAACCALYADRRDLAWLDSARVGPGVARWSYLAVPDGPLGRVLRHDVRPGATTVELPGASDLPRTADDPAGAPSTPGGPTGPPLPGGAAPAADPLAPGTHPGDPLNHLDRVLAAVRCDEHPRAGGFAGGLVGGLGSGLQTACGLPEGPDRPPSREPDALLLLCDRVLAFDHLEGRVQLRALARTDDADAQRAARGWLDVTEGRLAELAGAAPAPAPPPAPRRFVAADDPGAYAAKVDELRAAIAAGETYEACLTTELHAPADPAFDVLAAYRALRRANPAPHGALLRAAGTAVLSSSPERFLAVAPDGGVEARPIKGTAPRAADPQADAAAADALQRDPKARAENLMIADLLRNDLGRVCTLGSVRTPELMVVESHATVHQLVTGVVGRLRDRLGPLDAVRACFPPGSMTGAPKRRTLEILERLEGRPRGLYAGALGWLSADGGADLSVVIRAVVADRHGLRVGSGGAIVDASDPEAEHAEMLLKARAVVEGVGGRVALTAAARGLDGAPSAPPARSAG